MTKTLLYARFAYKTFLVVFALVTLPFAALRLYGVELPELPFMFLVLLGLIKFYMASFQTDKAVQAKLKRQMGPLSNQKLVDNARAYKNASDLALLANAVLIFIANIFIGAFAV